MSSFRPRFRPQLRNQRINLQNIPPPTPPPASTSKSKQASQANMPPSNDITQAPIRANRPSLQARKSSTTSSHVSQSPSGGEGPSPSHRSTSTSHYKPQRRVVGTGRMGSRNRSFGKNLNALTKITPASRHDGGVGEVKAQRRSHSGESVSGGSTKGEGAGIRRNASAVVLSRNTSNVSLRKNLSSGQLKKNLSSGQLRKNLSSGQLKKNLSSGQLARLGGLKTVVKKGQPGLRKTTPHQPKATIAPDVPNPTVRFAVGDDDDDEEIEEIEGVDDAWTEVGDSASQSPNTTRSNTRQNSVILDSGQAARAQRHDKRPEAVGSERSSTPEAQQSPSTSPKSDTSPLTLRSHVKIRAPNDNHPSTNGNSPRPHHNRVPSDADVITSRLLQRNPQHHASPQVSNISATVQGHFNIRSASSNMISRVTTSQTPAASQPSTLKSSTSGKDLVSRFINKGGESIEGTPADSKYLLHRSATNHEPTTSIVSSQGPYAEDDAAALLKRKFGEAKDKEKGKDLLDASKRNKSTPNISSTAVSSAVKPTPPAGEPATFSSLFDRSGSGRRSGTSTPGAGPGPAPGHHLGAGSLSLNRAEQKLLLQRDASVLETNINLNVPGVVSMNRSVKGGGVPAFVIGGSWGSPKRKGKGIVDPRMRRWTEDVDKEYSVIRRFRNPVADAIVRVRMFNGKWNGSGGGVPVGKGKGSGARQEGDSSAGGTPSSAGITRGGSSARAGTKPNPTKAREGGAGQYGLSQSLKEGRESKTGKRKVSFEVSGQQLHGRRRSRSRDDADIDEEEDDEHEEEGGEGRGTRTSELEEICRRIWEGFGLGREGGAGAYARDGVGVGVEGAD